MEEVANFQFGSLLWVLNLIGIMRLVGGSNEPPFEPSEWYNR